MALVLRNASIQKQVSLLKCMKTRTVVTTANKNNNQAPISAASELEEVSNSMPNTNVGCRFHPSFYNLKPSVSITALPKRSSYALVVVDKPDIPDVRKDKDDWMKARSMSNLLPQRKYEDSPPKPLGRAKSAQDVNTTLNDIVNTMLACPCGPCGPCCPCGPCGPCGTCCGNMTDCNCARLLPPPCNTPPKCIQYMQGYYYYPYGTWFCGPYHVSTGGVPVCGPVCPGTSCGIAPPNPNAFCGKCSPCCGPCCCGVVGCTMCNPPSWGSRDNSQNTNQGKCAWFGGIQSSFCVPYANYGMNNSWNNSTASHCVSSTAESAEPETKPKKSTSTSKSGSVGSQGISSEVVKRYPFKNTAAAKPDVIDLTT